jgi:ATP-dependent protease HslVU (ClpYQ) peptidase subunit
MASDSQATRGNTKSCAQKLFRRGNVVLGAVGSVDYITAFLNWWDSGQNLAKYPKCQESDDYSIVAEAHSNGTLRIWERSPFPWTPTFAPYYAIGSGREVALGALWMGANAEQAVAAANEFAEGCGGPLQIERLM